MRRSLTTGLALATVLLGPVSVLTAGPASAGNGTSSVGCTTGDSCEIQLKNSITVGGFGASQNDVNTVTDIAPPPCLWVPIGDTLKGSQAIVDIEGSDPKTATTEFQVNLSVQQAVTYLKAGASAPAGNWYELPINPVASAAARAECLKMPLYQWEPPGQLPREVDLPPATLAQMALAQMNLPTTDGMTLEPATQTYTNLPTFLQVKLTPGTFEQVTTAQGLMPYTTTYAEMKDDPGDAATVWAYPSKLDVSASGGGQYTMATRACGYLGSTELGTPAAANAGPGDQPDCGAVFQSPATWQLTATQTWTACWAEGVHQGAPPPGCAQHQVAGAELQPLNWKQGITVDEIQSVNGNGNGNG